MLDVFGRCTRQGTRMQFALTVSITLVCMALQSQALQVFLRNLMHLVLTYLLIDHWSVYCNYIVFGKLFPGCLIR